MNNVMATIKTSPAADEPMMSGSFCSMLELYSSARDGETNGVSDRDGKEF